MIRVKDLEQSKAFYRTLGLEVVRETEYASGKFTLVFMRCLNDESPASGESGEIELTYNWDHALPYEIGDAWGHVAFSVENIYTTCDRLRAQGMKITREPGPMKHGDTVIAFLDDPDGHKIELIERK